MAMRPQEAALLLQVGLAGLPDDLGDVGHGGMDGQAAGLQVFPPTEEQAQRADAHAGREHGQTGHGAAGQRKRHGMKIRDLDLGLVSERVRRTGEHGSGAQGSRSGRIIPHGWGKRAICWRVFSVGKTSASAPVDANSGEEADAEADFVCANKSRVGASATRRPRTFAARSAPRPAARQRNRRASFHPATTPASAATPLRTIAVPIPMRMPTIQPT